MREQRAFHRGPSFCHNFWVVLLVAYLAIVGLSPGSARAASAHEYEASFGPDGSATTQFETPGPIAIDQESHDIYVADLEAGTVYRFDENHQPADFSTLGSHALTGFSFFAESGIAEIAVDSTSEGLHVPTHDFYVADLGTNSIKAFHADGSEAKFTVGPDAGTNELTEFGEVCGVAVDSSGNIYAGDYETGVHVFAPSGEEITSFSAPIPCNVAVDSKGTVYVNRYTLESGEVLKFVPSEYPVTATTTYPAIGASVHPEGAYAIAIDPSADDLYVANRVSPSPKSEVVQYDEEGIVVSTFGGPGEPGELSASEGVGADEVTEKVYASDEQGQRQVEVFAPPPPEPPGVESTTVSDPTATAANLRAQINPHLFATTYHFEYVTQTYFEASGFTGAAKTAETAIGSAGEPRSAQAHVGSLTPDTPYRFRVVAKNAGGESASVEPAPGFSTFPAFPAGLPDSRAYEMVSPPQKAGEVLPPEPTGDFSGSCSLCLPGTTNQMMPMQSNPNGDAVVYVGQPFTGGLASGPNEYRSRRGLNGWETQGLSSPLFESGQGYAAFSTDLSRSVLSQIEPVLSPQAPTREGKGFANLYLSDGDGSLQPLVTAEPLHRTPGQSSTSFVAIYSGANSGTDLAPAFTHVVFEANDALTDVTATAPAAVDGGIANDSNGFPANLNLYEWVGGQLRLVNVLPGNTSTAPGAVAGSGALHNLSRGEARDVDHAISDDGSRIFWSEESSGRVYVRIEGQATQKIEDPGKFLTASSDGTKVLLDDGCLYSLQAKVCEDLTGAQGGFQGILGASEDLSRVYFVDTKALTPPSQENANHEHAEATKNNLYVWHAGATVFIGILGSDNTFGVNGRYGTWKASPSNRTAQVSPDGRYLAFMSKAPLTGYDNSLSGGGICKAAITSTCFEVFEYDASSAKLSCPSCSPTGLRPLGLSNLSLIRSRPQVFPFPQPGNLTAGGQGRLFFESQDVLSSRDVNGHIQDVYEWEPNGVGSCERAAGCLFLISSGHSNNDSFFIDATPSGNDAFIVTRERLLPQDKDERLDLYDARVGGGIEEPISVPCSGEACKGSANAPPDQQSAASTSFSGPPNPKPNRHNRKHKKHHKHKKKHHGRPAKHNRGGSK